MSINLKYVRTQIFHEVLHKFIFLRKLNTPYDYSVTYALPVFNRVFSGFSGFELANLNRGDATYLNLRLECGFSFT